MCEHGRRVASRLRQMRESLVAEAKRCETIVEVEVGKVKAEIEKEIGKVNPEMEKEAGKLKAEMENKIARYCKEIEIWKIKRQAMKKNHQKILVCSWILCTLCLFLFGYTSKGPHDGKVGRMTLL
jgi:hypothetical protein